MGGKGKKPEISDNLLNIRRRLHDALSLGIRVSDGKFKRWQSKDADIQSHALKAMFAFLNCLPSNLLQHPLIQDSVLEMVVALGGILQSDNKNILNLAADVTQKLVTTLGNTVHRYPMLDVTISLSQLLSLSKIPVAISSATALYGIIVNLGPTKTKIIKDVWSVLETSGSVGSIIYAIQNYARGNQPIEYFLVMASLLESILIKWPQSRYPVWSNSDLMINLQEKCADSETSIAIGALKLCSALALCGNGALILLKNKAFIYEVIQRMGISHPLAIRIEALSLCRHLSKSEVMCSMLISSYCEPIVQGIIGGMGGWRSSCSKRVPFDQLPLVLEACRTALLTHWAGEQHLCFWKYEIDRVLLDILLGDCTLIDHGKVKLSSDELVAKIYSNTAETTPFVWDILGNLAVHFEESYSKNGEFLYLDFLIHCACSVTAAFMQKGHSSLSSHMNELEPVSRAVLLMVFSPCKFIASKARYHLSEILQPSVDVFLDYVLASLKLNAAGDISLVSNSLHTTTNLIGLACYSTLPKYRYFIVRRKGISSLSNIIRMCLNSDLRISRSNNASHLQNSSNIRECCWNNMRRSEDEEAILLYSLQALSQLIGSIDFVCNHHKVTSGQLVVCITCEKSDDSGFIGSLQYILHSSFSPGVKWFAAYILSFFGFYGFPSKLGKRMAKLIDDDELADVELVLSKYLSLRVHAPIISARCPYLLSGTTQKKNTCDEKCKYQTAEHHNRNLRHEIRISDRVDRGSLVKMLEYVYTGFFQVDDNIAKTLRILAKSCGLKSLYDMLERKLPRWGIPCLSFSLSEALETNGNQFSDIILEAKVIEGAACNCRLCQLSAPHIHAHKIILSSSCDYLRALFSSGMHESSSEVIKVPVSWKALTKLVHWFYSGYLPTINPDCCWNNMNPELQLQELEAYVELSSLAEFWCLEELEEESFQVVAPCISSPQKCSPQIIRFAASLSQWKIVAAGVGGITPLYPKLRDSGGLDDMDEELTDMLRAEYVRYCQHGESGSVLDN